MRHILPVLTILAALLLSSLARATAPDTVWTRTYGGPAGEEGCAVDETDDGGYIIVGCTESYGAGREDVYLIKTDANGDSMWTRTYGGPDHDYGLSVQQATDGGFVIVGYTASYGVGSWDVLLMKTDSTGSTVWRRTYGGANEDIGRSFEQTSDGGFMIAGETRSIGHGLSDVYLIKTDATGDTVWTRTYGGAYDDVAYSVQQTYDGGYIVTGYTAISGLHNWNVYLVRIDARGGTLWTREYGSVGSTEYGMSVQQTTDSGYILTGAGYSQVFTIRTDTGGDTLWTRTYSNSPYDLAEGHSVRQTADGGYVIAGYISPWGPWDLWLIRINADGDRLWAKTLVDTGSGTELGNSVHLTSHGGYIVAGATSTYGAGGADVYLVRVDSDQVAVAEPKADAARAKGLSFDCEPNPCRSSTVVHLTTGPLDRSTTLLGVYDAQGRLVHSTPGIRNSPFLLDLRSMPSGTYFVRLDVGDKHATRRVVLQR